MLNPLHISIKKSYNMSRCIGKPAICLSENKGADQLCMAKTKKQIRCAYCAFVFATRIEHFFYFLNPKFPASSHLLCLYSLVCVGPVRKAKLLVFLSAGSYSTKIGLKKSKSKTNKKFLCGTQIIQRQPTGLRTTNRQQ